MLPSQELIDYVWAHRDEDVRTLALRSKNAPQGFALSEALSAIQARQKLALKHPRWAEAKAVFIPQPVVVEQSSSPETSAYKLRFIEPHWQILDLSGGMGADSYALAQKAEGVTYLDASPERAELAAHNFLALGQRNITCYSGKAEERGMALAEALQPQLIYLDPDRRPGATARVFLIEECAPDITTLIPKLQAVAPRSQYLIKLSPMADLTYLRERLPYTFDIYVVSLKREAKELLLHLHPSATGCITAVELQAHHTLSYSTRPTTQQTTPISPEIGAFVHDLYPAFSKVGYDTFALPFEVWQPAAHTHLYFSRTELTDFPGRTFTILEHNLGDKRWLKKVTQKPLHLITKNLPTSTDQLRRQLRITEGGDCFLIAYADSLGKRHFLLAT